MHTPRSLRRTTTAVLAALAFMMIAQPKTHAQELPDVFNLAPADAQFIFVVPNMATLGERLGVINNSLGLGVAGMADALGEFKRSIGINKGMRDDGAMLLAIANVSQLSEGEEADFVLLMPVSDYGAFVSNFGGLATGVAELTLPNGEKAFSKQSGSHAVMSSRRERIDAYAPTKDRAKFAAAAGKLGTHYLTSSHVSVMLRISSMSAKLQDQLAAAMKAAMEEVSAAPGGAAAAAMMTMYGDALNAIVRDSETAVMGLDAGEEGIGMTMALQLKPNTPTAKTFGNAGGAGNILNQMPNRPYLWANAFSVEGIGLSSLLDEILGRMKGDLAWVSEMVQPARPLVDKTRRIAQVIYAPQGAMGLGTNLLSGVTVIETTNGQEYANGFKDYINSLNNRKFPVGPPPNAMPGAPVQPLEMSITSSYTANALAVEGSQVDQYSIQYNFPPQLLQQMGQAGGLMMMLGGGGQTGYTTVKDNLVLMTTTPDPQLMKSALSALGSPDAGMGENVHVKAIRANLTPDPMAEFYLDVGSIAKTVSMIAGMMMGGQAELIKAPDDLPPVAVSASIQDGGFAKRLYVPMSVIRFGRDATQQAMQAFAPQEEVGEPGADGQQGGAMDGPGGPGGPPPAPR